jgi:protein N-terminal methyltransferase
LCYLTDEDLVTFLKRCGDGLLEDGQQGVIILKENTCDEKENTFVLDNDDASVTRSLPYWLALIELAGLKVIKQDMQHNFPDELFPVPMLALQVDRTKTNNKD